MEGVSGERCMHHGQHVVMSARPWTDPTCRQQPLAATCVRRAAPPEPSTCHPSCSTPVSPSMADWAASEITFLPAICAPLRVAPFPRLTSHAVAIAPVPVAPSPVPSAPGTAPEHGMTGSDPSSRGHRVPDYLTPALPHPKSPPTSLTDERQTQRFAYSVRSEKKYILCAIDVQGYLHTNKVQLQMELFRICRIRIAHK